MDSSMLVRKQSDLAQLTHQFKVYKDTYGHRILPPKNVHTYLQLTQLIIQLAPTCLSHYAGYLSREETNDILDNLIDLNQDILSKLRNLAEKAGKKEGLQLHPCLNKEICRVCLKELRTIEVTTTKDELENQNELSRSIFKVMKEIEADSTPFSFEEDRNFFKELAMALDKKKEVIEFCASESEQFTHVINSQLQELSLLTETLHSEPWGGELGNKSSELKDSVSRSIKQTIYSKLPQIISIVARNLIRSKQKDKKMRTAQTGSQTVEFENPKLSQFKKKLTMAESIASAAMEDKEKLSWSLTQKQAMIDKIDQQLLLQRQEANQTQKSLRRQIKELEQKCRKLREQTERQKLKSKKQLFDRQTQSNIRTMKSINKLKEVSMMEEDQLVRKRQLAKQISVEERPKSKKRTLYNTKDKFYLPSLNKINRQDSQLLSRSQIQNQNQSFERLEELNQTVKTDIVKDKIKEDVKYLQNKSNNFSKTNVLQKRGKNQVKKNISIIPNKIENSPNSKRSQSKNKPFNKTEATSPRDSHVNNKDKGSSLNSKGVERLPSISRKNNIESKTRDLITPDSRKEVRIAKVEQEEEETRDLRQSVKGVDIFRENKMRSSKTSLNSAISISNGLNQGNQKKEKASILKSTLLKPKKQQNFQTNLNQNLSFEQRFFKNNNQNYPQRINQEIQKECYMTPKIGTESPGSEVRIEDWKTRISKQIESNISKLLKEKPLVSEQIINMKSEQFGTLFVQCLDNMSRTSPDQLRNQIPLQQRPISFHKDKKLQDISNSIFSQLSINRKEISRIVRLSTESCADHSSQIEGTKTPTIIHYNDKLKPYKEINEQQKILHRLKTERNVSLQNGESSVVNLSLAKKKLLANSKSIEPIRLTFQLFINQEKSYEYQSSFTKKVKLPPLSPELQTYTNHIYTHLQEIRYLNSENYQNICSYLRYPFSSVQPGCFHIDIVKSISQASLCLTIQRISLLHRKCKQQDGICVHLASFRSKIQSFLEQY